MKEYPQVITAEMLTIYAHISDEEINADIVDTEREIRQYRDMQAAEQRLAASHVEASERKMNAFRASARPNQIAEREEFVAFLRRVQAARNALQVEATPNDTN